MREAKRSSSAPVPTAASILEKYPPRRDRILSALHELQSRLPGKSWISDEELAETARYFDVPLAELDGVVSFYALFSRKKRGEHVIRLCDSLSCRICGSLDLYHHLRERLGITRGMTTGDRRFTLEIVNCLGACSTAPNMMIDDRLVSGLSVIEIDTLLDQFEEAKS